jgi:hypothetical protein
MTTHSPERPPHNTSAEGVCCLATRSDPPKGTRGELRQHRAPRTQDPHRERIRPVDGDWVKTDAPGAVYWGIGRTRLPVPRLLKSPDD